MIRAAASRQFAFRRLLPNSFSNRQLPPRYISRWASQRCRQAGLLPFLGSSSSDERSGVVLFACSAVALTLMMASAVEDLKLEGCRAQCEARPLSWRSAAPNPLWPSGVSSAMVNRYVDEILADRAVNITSIPDSVERIIYVTTVRLTLNTVYQALSEIHGLKIMGHRLELARVRQPEVSPHDVGSVFASSPARGIDKVALEAMADDLLANKSVNQRWIPDRVERQVYRNCLILIFTVLDRVADTLAIRLCGHELSVSFEPVTADRAKQLVTLASEERERPSIDDATLEALVTEALEESGKAGTSKRSLVSFLPFYRTFLKELHKTLYGLILGIIDDLLSKTELVVLEERIQIKLVPDNTSNNKNT